MKKRTRGVDHDRGGLRSGTNNGTSQDDKGSKTHVAEKVG